MKYRSKESKNPVVANNVLEGLKSHANSSCVCLPILNETVAKNSKIFLFIS